MWCRIHPLYILRTLNSTSARSENGKAYRIKQFPIGIIVIDRRATIIKSELRCNERGVVVADISFSISLSSSPFLSLFLHTSSFGILRPCNHFWQRKRGGRKNRLELRQRFSPHRPTCYRFHSATHVRAHVIHTHTNARTYLDTCTHTHAFARCSQCRATSPCSSDLFISDETELVVISTLPQRQRNKKSASELVGKMHFRFSDASGHRREQYFRRVREFIRVPATFFVTTENTRMLMRTFVQLYNNSQIIKLKTCITACILQCR